MILVLHVIQALSLGGAARALVATSKASACQGPYRHRVISLLRPAPEAVRLAEEAGLTVVAAPDAASLRTEMTAADIVQLHWWNNPQNQQLLRYNWPESRLLIWYHVAGDHPPQLITRELADFADLNVPTNPWSFRELPVFREMSPSDRERRLATVIDAADLDRVAGAELRPHPHFNVGYIGAVDFVKMHRSFVPMSAAVRVPDVRFVVCGHGIERELEVQARELGAGDRFEFRGYVHDIRPVIETFDVYGYPLCANSYASGELNLQEVMAVGVPPVVFPAGGIKGLVEHDKTGLVVATETEYAQAIEHLFHHPDERRRLGRAAREHAQAHFGAENAARQLNPLYERLLGQPKRTRQWGVPLTRSILDQPVSMLDVVPSPADAAGAWLFAESLGDAGGDFVTSLTSSDFEELSPTEHRIAAASELVRSVGAGGFRQYLRNYPRDGFLLLWHALALEQEGKFAEAVTEFGRAIECGCDHWRVRWYLAQAAQRAGNTELAEEAARSVVAAAPEFRAARQFLEGLYGERFDEPRASVVECASPLALLSAGAEAFSGEARHPSRTALATESGGGPPHSKTSRQVGRSIESEPTPLISAIVSTYNSERFIRGCLADLERQTIADRLEIIVIDSGSQQNERAIVEEFQRSYTNIQYLRTEREPLYTAWNRGARLARGIYLTNANTDDRHRSDGLERHVQALEQNPDSVLAYADVVFCEEVHPDFGEPQFRGIYHWPEFDGPLLFANCYIGPQPVWRREVHERYGFFDESYQSAGDYEFWLRLAVRERFIHLPEVLGLYWYSTKSVGHDNMGLTRAEADRARRAHWEGAWATWPKLKQALLEANPSAANRAWNTGVAERAVASERRREDEAPRQQSGKPRSSPGRSPFVLDFGGASGAQVCAPEVKEMSHKKAQNAQKESASSLGPFEPFRGQPSSGLGGAHRDRLLSFVPPDGRVLVWGASDSIEDLTARLPLRARLTWIENDRAAFERLAPVLQASGVECLRGNPESASGDEVTPVGLFDVVLVAGERRSECLERAVELLSGRGVVFLRDAQRPEFDSGKRAAIEFGHLGPCPEAPGSHFWWGGASSVPVRPSFSPGSITPIVVNFYTTNTPYEDEARRLQASCRAVGVECHSEGVPATGDWVRNCAMKARFILQAWEKLRRPVLWLDADAVLHARPELLVGATCDFAVHKIDGWQFASGTIFFQQTPVARRLLERWVERCERDPSTWDQVSLDLAWEDIIREWPLETLWLPETYTKIFDRPSRVQSADIVVEHFQASRRLKEKVSENQNDQRPQYSSNLMAVRRASRPLPDRSPAADLFEAAPGFTSTRAVGDVNGELKCTEDLLRPLRGRRIAIVGNATPANDCGTIIDGYDVVIRINNFRTAGFEARVGQKTTYRCTSGWRDIESRKEHPEFSPFAAHLPESTNVPAYNSACGRPLLVPQTDIHLLLLKVPKPSTGCALVALCSNLGLSVDLFAFDGFRTSHYWAPGQAVHTTHDGGELEVLRQLPGVTFHSTPMNSSHEISDDIEGSAPPRSLPSPDTFGLPAGYESRLQPEYYEDSVTHATGIVWQPDVYPMAAMLARRFGCFHILDLGCGRGDKLAGLHPDFLITGVDFGANIKQCREQYAFGQWLEADLGRIEQLPIPTPVLARTVVVCSDVIEHLVNPTALLRLLAQLLEQAALVVLSTPDRERARGQGDLGPPKNKAHVREWTLAELEGLLRRFQLPVEFIGFTRSNTQTGVLNTQFALLRRPEPAGTPLIPGAHRGDGIEFVDGHLVVLPPLDAGPADTASPAKNSAANELVPAGGAAAEAASAVLDAAEAQAREALRLNPTGLEALRLMVNIGLQRQRWEEAGRRCVQILQQAPDDIQTLLSLAKCFFKSGDRDTTREVLERVLQVDPENALARENLAALGIGKQSSVEALAACLTRAQQALSERKLTEARAALEEAVVLDRQAADVFVALGNVQAEMGDKEAARWSYARALEIDPEHQMAGDRIVELTVGGEVQVPARTAQTDRTDQKASAELAYWKARKQEEGALANKHYRAFYTTHFALPYEFYAGKRVLDIGCGPRGSLEWAEHAAERVGLDPLADRYRELGVDAHRMRYVASGSEAIPFPDDHFDVVTSFNSLDHVANLDRTIDEIMRVVKPDGLLLLLTDVNHSPTACEPIEFGWDIVDRFKGRFEVVDERHYEKVPKVGLYRSIEEGLPYDHANPVRRYGILSVKLRKRPVTQARPEAGPRSGGPNGATAEAASRNRQAFEHLQRAFDLMRERRFLEAQAECASYRERVSYDALPRADRRTSAEGNVPEVSVVIVAYRIGRGLIGCLDSLITVPGPSHEIIVVDNGGNEDIAPELEGRPILHIRVPMNVILSEGRNIGVHFARAPIVAFVDDDALAVPKYLDGVVAAFRKFDIDGYRGMVRPKSDQTNNSLARHYNMGDLAFPADVDTEGNSAFATAVYRELGGMDPLLFGMEGTELSYRIAARRGEYRTIYWPGAVIQHDYASTDSKLEQKNSRHRLMKDYAVWKHPGLMRHHNDLIAFNQSDAARRTGHGLLRRRAEAGVAQPPPAVSGSTFAPVPATPHTAEPFFSICVPTYNRARFIRETLESALKQTYPNFEIVIVDDGSTDETATIVGRYRTEKIRYIRKEHSGGPATRNRCIAEAKGDFLVWVDSDDAILPRTLEIYAAALEKHPEVDALYGDLRIINEESVGEMIWGYRDYLGWPEAMLTDLVFENKVPNVCTLVRKSAYARVGGYSEEFPRAHDYEFWARLAADGSVHRVNAIVGLYRQHVGSLSQHRGNADTSYEAQVVQALLQRHHLCKLLPFCFGPGISKERSTAHGWLIAAMIMLKYGQRSIAVEYFDRARQADALPAIRKLARIIKVAEGRPPGAAEARRSSGEFVQLVDRALNAFHDGRADECAKACARMTELRPEELETLALVGLSLQRWGDARAGRTALGCLANRLAEAAYTEAAASTGAAPSVPAESGDAGGTETWPLETKRALAKAAASVFQVSTVPEASIMQALRFIGQIGEAAVPRQRVASEGIGFTPVFAFIMGLSSDELVHSGGDRLRDVVQRARPGLAVEAANRREDGWSFCIITHGRRPEKLRRQIESIRALGLARIEILVAGEIPAGFEDVTAVPMSVAAAWGRLAEMRNALASRARYDRIVVSDDDLVFAPDFAEGLRRLGDDFEVMAVRMENPDGSRFWDWATVGGPRGQVLLEYSDIDPDVYVTGGLCILKAAVWDQVKWDENRGFYEAEDVDFSRRLKAAGVSIRFNPYCRVTHDDDRYTRVGRKVMRFDHIVTAANEAFTAGDEDAGLTYLHAAAGVAANDAKRRTEVLAVAQRHGRIDRLKGWMESAGVEATSETAPVRVQWDGSFLDLGSLSHVNRELTAALGKQPGIELTCRARSVDPMSLRKQPALRALAERLSAQPATSEPPRITVRHAWPPDWCRPRQGAWVLIQPWEFGALPEEWVRELSRVDEVWVPSQCARRAYLDSGIDPAKVHVVPNGFDPARFYPKAPSLKLTTKKKFKFLFVGGTIQRKGPDVLLKAYLDRFTAADDVCLVIKDFGGQSVYAGQTFAAQIAAARATPNAPEILYLTDDLTPTQMSGLYTACDCLVHPYRGEGFGLPVLEAMACARPVVVTAGGATDDFVTEECGWRIPSVRRQFGDTVSGMKLVKPGWWLEPDVQALGERLAWLAANPNECRSRGEKAACWALAHWTWDHAALIAKERLQAIMTRDQSKSAAKLAGQSKTAKAAKARAIELPVCARVGHLAEARTLLEQKKFTAAWQATIEALGRRPFHPEAWLTLAEIAQATGDVAQVSALAGRARAMAPKWKPAQRLAKAAGKKAAGGVPKLSLPALPESLGTSPGRLSVCLIARNEEQFLDRCLESVRDLASQIVVVDTGSTDRTSEIARRHGAEVHSFVWCDDFSAARNAALEHATGDWVLFLDADEELVAADHQKLRALMANPAVLAYRLPIVDQGREEEGVNYVPRLYRNAPGLFYVGRIHEQVFSSIEVRRTEWGLENRLGDATLLHYGYTAEVMSGRDKIARNLRLLELAIEELPGEPNLLMNLGLELVRAGRRSEGLERYQEAFEAMSTLPKDRVSPELREALLTQYGTHLLAAKHHAEMSRLYLSPLAKAHGLTASMHWLLGLACIESKLYSEGVDQMRQCLAKRKKPALTLINRNILKGAPHHCLALCLAALERNDEAAGAFQAALHEDPAARRVRFDFARFLAGTGQEVEALKWIHQLMADDPSDIPVWRLGGAVALQKPDFIEYALDWTGEAVKAHSSNGALLEQRATALLLAGRVSEAQPIWRQLTETGSAPPSAWAARLLCETARGQMAPAGSAASFGDQVDAEFLRWYRQLLRWNASGVVVEINARIEILRPRVPSTVRQLEAAFAEAAA